MLDRTTRLTVGIGMLLSLPALLGAAEHKNSATAPACFSAMVDPAGWAIPVTKGPLESGPFRQAGFPPEVTMTRYASAEPAWLPRYYVEDGRLIMRSLKCRLENVTRLEVAARPFAFFGVAKGLDVGIAGDVWWVDGDGDGRFEEFQWITDARPPIPAWALAMSSKSQAR